MGRGRSDEAVFDCGSGVCAIYNATGVKWSDRLRGRVGRPADALLGDRIAWSCDLMVFRV